MICAVAISWISVLLFVDRWRSIEVEVVVAFLHLRGVSSVHPAGDQILVLGGAGHTFSADVGRSCSSLVVVVAFATFASIVASGNHGRRWRAFGLAAGLIVASNLVRIALTVLVGIRSGPASIQGFHDGFAVWFAVVCVLGAFALFVAALSVEPHGRRVLR